jgi:hypothetical protein
MHGFFGQISLSHGRSSLSHGRISLSLSSNLSFFVIVSVESSPVVKIWGLVIGWRLRGGSVINEYNGVKRDFAVSFFLCFKTATFVLMQGWVNPSPSSNYKTKAGSIKISVLKAFLVASQK